jgi:hypothetical protein
VTVSALEPRFRQAAWTYLGYGVVYWVTALWLQLTVFPVRGPLLVWFGAGALIAVGVPWLLWAPRAWFERWVLSRRDFARILAVLVALRAVFVGRLALLGPESMRMPGMGGGVPPNAAGAWLMAAIAAVTAVMLARAAWQCEASRGMIQPEAR